MSHGPPSRLHDNLTKLEQLCPSTFDPFGKVFFGGCLAHKGREDWKRREREGGKKREGRRKREMEGTRDTERGRQTDRQIHRHTDRPKRK